MIIISDYKLIEEIGRGSYGEVWSAYNIQKNKKVAIKIERKSSNNVLKYETIILRYLKDLDMVPNVKYFGQTTNYNYMVMELLGNTIDIYYLIAKLNTVNEIKWIGLKMIECLEQVHNNGIVHRDIKPENFLMTSDDKTIKIIDFGIAKQYIDSCGKHRKNNTYRNIAGTLRYISTHVHEGLEPSRRDDLISVIYVLLYLLKDKLPWQRIKNNNKLNKYVVIYEMKKTMEYSELCENISNKFQDMLEYVYSLDYSDTPNYEYLYFLLKTIE